MYPLVGFAGLAGLFGLAGLAGLAAPVELVGLVGLPELAGLAALPGFEGLVEAPVFGAVPLGVLGAPGAVGFKGCLATPGTPGVGRPDGIVGCRDDPDAPGMPGRSWGRDVDDPDGICDPARGVDEPAELEEPGGFAEPVDVDVGVPAVPGIESASNEPVMPDVNSVSEVSAPPDDDAVPDVPAMPDVDPAADEPAPPDVDPAADEPAIPGVDPAADEPAMPGADPVPDVPDLPGADAVPYVPDLPGADAMPDVPDDPATPGVDAVADVPGVDDDEDVADVDGLTVAEGCGDGGCDGGAGALNVPVAEFVFDGGTGADGGRTSTDRVKVRFSAACRAPTLTTWRVTSSPRSLRMAMITKYSSGCSFGGCRMMPSTRNAGAAATCRFAASESKRRWCMQPGQILRLSRIVALQCGQVRVLPVDTGREATLMNRCRIPWQWSYGLRYPNRIRPGRASASPPQRSVIQPSRRR